MDSEIRHSCVSSLWQLLGELWEQGLPGKSDSGIPSEKGLQWSRVCQRSMPACCLGNDWGCGADSFLGKENKDIPKSFLNSNKFDSSFYQTMGLLFIHGELDLQYFTASYYPLEGLLPRSGWTGFTQHLR